MQLFNVFRPNSSTPLSSHCSGLDKDQLKNYRPVSNLPFLSKLETAGDESRENTAATLLPRDASSAKRDIVSLPYVRPSVRNVGVPWAYIGGTRKGNKGLSNIFMLALSVKVPMM